MLDACGGAGDKVGPIPAGVNWSVEAGVLVLHEGGYVAGDAGHLFVVAAKVPVLLIDG